MISEDGVPSASIRAWLAWLVLFCLLPGVLGAGLLFLHEYRQTQAEMEKDTLQTVRALSQAVDNHIQKALALGQGLSTANSLARADLAGFQKRARRALEQSDLGLSLTLVGPDGEQLLTTLKEFGEPLPRPGNQEIFRRVFETGRPAFSDLYLGGVSGRLVMVVAVPVVVDGKVAYAMAVSIPSDKFDGILASQGLPPGWVAAILDSSSTIVARSRESAKYAGQKPAEEFIQRRGETKEGVLNFTMKDGVPVLSVYASSPLTNWWVAVNIPLDALQARLLERLSLLAVGVTALFAIGLCLAWFMGGKIAGLFGQASQALRESESRFRLMADYAPVMIWLSGTDTLCHWFNRPWLDFTGRTMEQERGAGWAEGVHPDDVDRCLKIYMDAFSRLESFAMEYRLRRRDGEYRWIVDQGAPRFDAAGNFAGYVGACSDITERKAAAEATERLNAELENRVTERTAELVAANRELEAFTFATSHDLRGPLGRISSFSALLERKYRDRLEGEGVMFLEFIRENAMRLNYLVDDLLVHARVTQQALELQPLDAAAVIHAVVREKEDEIAEKGARVDVRLDGAEVVGDSHALGQVLRNLLENALKYCSPDQPPVIEIGGREKDGRFLLWVRDNGIGFDMAYHDRIFEIFRRLHTYREYVGSGVGLALVKRAMERMGGRVWAESEPGQGATFFLELAVPEPELEMAEA